MKQLQKTKNLIEKLAKDPKRHFSKQVQSTKHIEKMLSITNHHENVY